MEWVQYSHFSLCHSVSVHSFKPCVHRSGEPAGLVIAWLWKLAVLPNWLNVALCQLVSRRLYLLFFKKKIAVHCPWLTGVFLCCCSISITTSCYPLPSICFRDPVSDWFESLAECLHWNVRKKQNNFAVEEEEFWVSTSNKTHGNGKWQYPFYMLGVFKFLANKCGHPLRHI